MSHEGSGHISTEDEDKLDSVRPPNVNKNQNNNTANNRISTDSVFYRQSEELELTVRPTSMNVTRILVRMVQAAKITSTVTLVLVLLDTLEPTVKWTSTSV